MTDIVVEEVFPHAPETLWKALTTGTLIAKWLMTPTGFEAVKGNRFTFTTKPAGAWDGTIHCEILEAVPHQKLVYSWKSGHPDNVGYGAGLDTIVTWTLSRAEKGTKLRLVHSGFVLPKNETAHTNMGEGWRQVLPRIGALVAE